MMVATPVRMTIRPSVTMTGRSERGPVEPAHQHPLDQGPGDGGADDQDDEKGHQHRHVVRRDQFPVAEGGDHAHRALGEVEDPRGGVGDHQAGGGDGVPGAEHDPEDGVLQKIAHRINLVAPWPHVRPPGSDPTAQDAGGVM